MRPHGDHSGRHCGGVSSGPDRGSSANTRQRESHDDDKEEEDDEEEEEKEEDQQTEKRVSERQTVGTGDRASVVWVQGGGIGGSRKKSAERGSCHVRGGQGWWYLVSRIEVSTISDEYLDDLKVTT